MGTAAHLKLFRTLEGFHKALVSTKGCIFATMPQING